MIINKNIVNCIMNLTVLKGQIISAPGNAPGINGNNILLVHPERAV